MRAGIQCAAGIVRFLMVLTVRPRERSAYIRGRALVRLIEAGQVRLTGQREPAERVRYGRVVAAADAQLTQLVHDLDIETVTLSLEVSDASLGPIHDPRQN